MEDFIDINLLKEKCTRVRKDIIELVAGAASGHPGGSLSATEIFVAVYNTAMRVDPKNPKDPNRDRFVLSKGHCAPGYYAPFLFPSGSYVITTNSILNNTEF